MSVSTSVTRPYTKFNLRGFFAHKLHRAAGNKFGEVYSGFRRLPNYLAITHTELISFDTSGKTLRH